MARPTTADQCEPNPEFCYKGSCLILELCFLHVHVKLLLPTESTKQRSNTRIWSDRSKSSGGQTRHLCPADSSRPRQGSARTQGHLWGGMCMGESGEEKGRSGESDVYMYVQLYCARLLPPGVFEGKQNYIYVYTCNSTRAFYLHVDTLISRLLQVYPNLVDFSSIRL